MPFGAVANNTEVTDLMQEIEVSAEIDELCEDFGKLLNKPALGYERMSDLEKLLRIDAVINVQMVRTRTDHFCVREINITDAKTNYIILHQHLLPCCSKSDLSTSLLQTYKHTFTKLNGLLFVPLKEQIRRNLLKQNSYEIHGKNIDDIEPPLKCSDAERIILMHVNLKNWNCIAYKGNNVRLYKLLRNVVAREPNPPYKKISYDSYNRRASYTLPTLLNLDELKCPSFNELYEVWYGKDTVQKFKANAKRCGEHFFQDTHHCAAVINHTCVLWIHEKIKSLRYVEEPRTANELIRTPWELRDVMNESERDITLKRHKCVSSISMLTDTSLQKQRTGKKKSQSFAHATNKNGKALDIPCDEDWDNEEISSQSTVITLGNVRVAAGCVTNEGVEWNFL